MFLPCGVFQGRTVLANFDVRAKAGAADVAVVEEFNAVGSKTIRIDLTGDDSISSGKSESILSGIELEEEDTEEAK